MSAFPSCQLALKLAPAQLTMSPKIHPLFHNLLYNSAVVYRGPLHHLQLDSVTSRLPPHLRLPFLPAPVVTCLNVTPIALTLLPAALMSLQSLRSNLSSGWTLGLHATLTSQSPLALCAVSVLYSSPIAHVRFGPFLLISSFL